MRIVLYAAPGALLSGGCFAALGWNVRRYAAGGSAWNAVLVHLARIVAIGAALTLFALRGALPLLSGLAGFQLIRAVAINRQLRAFEGKP